MNFKKFINSDYLKNNPLCGIDTHKDTLNLATGACIRQIKKLVLTGTNADGEWKKSSTRISSFYLNVGTNAIVALGLCDRAINVDTIQQYDSIGKMFVESNGLSKVINLWLFDTNISLDDFKSYLAQQYAAGTPVTVWYVLAQPTTETITVPSGLSGAVEGYLNQSGTPTPTNPIYPTANTVEQWFDLNHYIMGTSTDTLTTLPAVLYPNDTTATVGLKGQTLQSSVPSPTSPVMPNGTGERTGNLADLYGVNKSALSLTFRTVDNMKIVIDGKKASGFNIISIKTPNISVPAGKYTVKIKMVDGHIENMPESGYGVFFGINQDTYAQRTTPGVLNIGDVGTRTFTLSEDTVISSFDITPGYTISANGPIFNNATFECWFYAGSNDKPYEPYGYKIPISSANTTTNIYLGEVETTRLVKKVTLTGNETFAKNDAVSTNYLYYIKRGTLLPSSIEKPPILCNELPAADKPPQSQIGISTNNIYNVVYFNFGADVMNAQPSRNTPEGVKEYLAAKYAAGTPVTVWYVLATEETGIINEPLMKIGNYADTVSGITIPVTAGADTLSVDTTVQPSEVTVNYNGWHPVADVHERESGQWD